MAIKSRYKAKFGEEVEDLPIESEIPFISKWNVAANETIVLPVGTEGVNEIEVDWGDGVVNREHSHMYSTAGVKEISILGRLEDFRFDDTNVSKDNLIEIVQWGDIEWEKINFYGCSNLTTISDDTPDFLNCQSLENLFANTGITIAKAVTYEKVQNVITTKTMLSRAPITLLEDGMMDNFTSLIIGRAMFQYTELTTLPDSLFKNCSQLVDLGRLLYNVSTLTNLPENVFIGAISLRDLGFALRKTAINNLPEKLLWSCHNLRSVEQMLFSAGITSLHKDFFKYCPLINNFNKFARNNPPFISDVPPIWMDFPNADGTDAFSIGTFPNVDEIPVEWGGDNIDWADEKGNVTHIWKGTQAGYDNVLPDAWKTNEKVLKIIGDGSVYAGPHGGGGTSSINNITEIPNRSYNDLQDKPGKYDFWFVRVMRDGTSRGARGITSKENVNFIQGSNSYLQYDDMTDGTGAEITIEGDPTFKPITVPNGQYAINESSNQLTQFRCYDTQDQVITIAKDNKLSNFILTARDSRKIILQDTAETKFVVGELETNIVQRGGTVMVFRDETMISEPGQDYRIYRVIGSLEPVSSNPGSGLTLGETQITAYRGDRGKIAYDHSQSDHSPSDAQKNSDITKSEIEAKLTGDISSHWHKREEKYIVGDQPYELKLEDKNKFLNIRNSNGDYSLTVNIPYGVFSNGDVIEGYSHYGFDFKFTSDLNYTRYPAGVGDAFSNSGSVKCNGYFKIIITSTSTTTPNASSAVVIGDFVKRYEVFESQDGTLYKVGVDNTGARTSEVYKTTNQ